MSIWKAKKTLLIVGEGYSEVAFLNHVKQLFSKRDDGLAIKIKIVVGNERKKHSKFIEINMEYL